MSENTFFASNFTDKEWLRLCAKIDEERKMAKLFGWEERPMFQDAYLPQGFCATLQQFLGVNKEGKRDLVRDSIAPVRCPNSSIVESVQSSGVPFCKNNLRIVCSGKGQDKKVRNAVLAAVNQS